MMEQKAKTRKASPDSRWMTSLENRLAVCAMGLVVTAALLAASPAEAQLGSSCTAELQNRTVRVSESGEILFTDMPAEPGRFRTRVTCASGEAGASGLFSFVPNGFTPITPVAFGDIAPLPVAIEIRPGTTTLTRVGQRTILNVVGFLENGNEVDLSNPGLGTEFWTSEARIAKLVTVQVGLEQRRALEAVERGKVLVAARFEGLLASVEVELPIPNDADDDGLTDEFEEIKGLDPNNPGDALEDPDADGLSNLQEFELGTEIFVSDTDADGLSDGREVLELGTDPIDPDSDDDRLLDGQELGAGTDPFAPDSDLDRLLDGLEVRLGLDPLAADPTTSVVGRVETADGTAVGDASVFAFEFLNAATGPTGEFFLDPVPAGLGDLEIVARAIRGGEFLDGTSVPSAPVVDGITDVGLIRIVPMRGRISGRVLRPQGGSVPDARVSVRIPAETRTAQADVNGLFILDRLPPGSFMVEALDPRSGLRGRGDVTLAESGDGADAVLDITLGAFGSIRGRVLGRDAETPVGAGVQVELKRDVRGGVLESTRTDAEGNYRFDFVPLGSFVLEASDGAPGNRGRAQVVIEETSQKVEADIAYLGRGTVEVVVENESGQRMPGAPIDLTASGIFGQELSAPADATGQAVFSGVYIGRIDAVASNPANGLSGSARGEIREDGDREFLTIVVRETATLTGRVFEVGGSTPVVGASVSISGRRTTTDAAGAYRFELLPLRTYDLRAEHPASVDCGRARATLNEPGETVSQDVVLNGLGEIIVTVRAADGANVSGARVDLGGGNPCGDGRRATTGESGRLVFPTFPKGDFRVNAESPVGGLRGSVASTLLVGESLDVTVELEPAGTIVGTVFAPDGVMPLGGIRVSLSDGRGTRSAPDGSFRFDFAKVASSPFALSALDGRGTRRARESGITVSAHGEVVRRDLVFSPTGTVVGTVFGVDGEPETNASVTVQSSAPGFRSVQVRTDVLGRYRATEVVIGSIFVSARDAGNDFEGQGDGELVAADEVITIDVQLSGDRILGRPFDANNYVYPIEFPNGAITLGALGVFRGDDGENRNGFRLALGEGGAFRDFVAGEAFEEEGGREKILTGRDDVSGLEITRKVFVPADGYFVRYLEILENPTAAPIEIDVRIDSFLRFVRNQRDGQRFTDSFQIVGTSSGEPLLEAGDRWAVLDVDLSFSPVLDELVPTLGHVFDGEGGGVAAERKVYDVDFGGGSATGRGFTRLRAEWRQLTVPPGASVALLHFGIQQSEIPAAVAAAERLEALPPEAIADLTTAEIDAVANFAVPTNGQSDLDPLPLLDGTITGTVLEGNLVTVVPGAEMRWRSEHPLFRRLKEFKAGGDGRYRLQATSVSNGGRTVVPRAEFRIEATNPRTRVLAPSVLGEIPPTSPSTVQDVVFTDTSFVEGNVRRSTGNVVSFGQVVLRARELLINLATSIATDGFYRFAGLPPEVYSLVATQPHPQGSPLRGVATAAVTEGGTTVLSDILMPATGGVDGMVETGNGVPAVSRQIELRGPGFVRRTTTDTGGFYRFLDVPVGTYTLTVFEPVTGIPSRAEVEILEGQVREQNLTLVGLATLDVRVLFEDGTPAGRAPVRLQAAAYGTTVLIGKTNADGRLIIDEVPGGSAVVRARHPWNDVIEAEVTITLDQAGVVVPAVVTLPIDRPPTVGLSQPIPGLQVSAGASVQVVASAQDDFGVVRVDFLVDGAVVASDTNFPYSASVISAIPAGGSFAVAARAVDQVGNTTLSSVVPVSVVADETAPSVAFSSPTSGADVIEGTTVSYRLTATDNVAVDRVEVHRDGALLGVDDAAPFELAFVVPDDFSGGSSAFLQVTATVFDRAGNSREAGHFLNVLDDRPPTITVVEAPATGSPVVEGTSLRFTANATDDLDADVDLVVDGAKVLTRQTTPFTFTLAAPAPKAAGQPVRVKLVARDRQGQTAETPTFELEVVPDAPPTVTLTAPPDGLEVTEGALLTLAADAADDVAVERVELLVDGTLAAELLEPPYETTFRIPAGEDGEDLAVTAIAVDSAGQIGADSVILTLREDLTAPTATIVGPADGSVLSLGGRDVVLALDARARTGLDAGLDLDGDGLNENVLEAEVVAAELALGLFDPASTKVGVARLQSATGQVLLGLTDDFAGVASRLDNVRVQGPSGSALLGLVVDAAIDELGGLRAQRDTTPTVLFFSDGDGAFPDEAVARAVDAGVVVHTFGVGFAAKPAVLTEISEATGGVYTALPDPNDVTEALPGILGLGGGEALVVEVAAADDGGLREVEVRVRSTDGSIDVVQVDGRAPYEMVFDLPVSGVALDLEITATARDVGGNETVTDPVTVTVGRGERVPRIVRLDPSVAGRGATMTVLGQFFDPLAAVNRVRFADGAGGVLATISSATKFALEITVPATAASGPVTVTVAGLTSNAVDFVLDADADGLSDEEEVVLGTDPQNPDSDDDGLSDGEEVNEHGTNPLAADTDGDGLTDAFELEHGFDPTVGGDGAADPDGDGLSNLEEQAEGTDPNNPDTDGDDLTDGDEVNVHGTDPNDPDTDDGGRDDGTEIAQGTNPFDPNDDEVTLPQDLIDGRGFRWDVQRGGQIARGTGEAFEVRSNAVSTGSGFRMVINNLAGTRRVVSTSSSALPEDGGRELVLGPVDPVSNGVELTRKIFVPDTAGRGFARFLELFENVGTEAREFEVEIESRIGTEAATEVVATSIDDGAFTQRDLYIVTDDEDAAGKAAVGFVFAGPTGGLLPSRVESTRLDSPVAEDDLVTYVYRLRLEPGETVALMHFGVQGQERADVLAEVISLARLEAPALDGLSPEEQAAVVNFFAFPDADVDGLADGDEAVFGTLPDNPDTDGDGLLDGFEAVHGFDPTAAGEESLDGDADGLNNLGEQLGLADPARADTDGDGLSDGDELLVHGSEPSLADTDGDGLRDREEAEFLTTDPGRFDTDGGGLSDGAELAAGSDPNDASDDRLFFSFSSFRVFADGERFRWPLLADGNVLRGTDDAFSFSSFIGSRGGFQAFLNGGFFRTVSSGEAEDGGREVRIGSLTGSLYRKIYVPDDEGFIRYLDVVQNRGSTSQTFSFRIQSALGSGTQTEVVTTGDGDLAFTPADRYIVTDDLGGDGVDQPAVTHVISGANAATRPVEVRGGPGDSFIQSKYSFSLAPGERAIFMHFGVQRHGRSAAIAEAERLANLEGRALSGLSEDERRDIRNFFAFPDADADGLSDADELALGTGVDNPDTDGDGLLDGFEARHDGLDPFAANDVTADTDGDGLDFLAEQAAGGDPNDPDSDDDRLGDGEEVALGTGVRSPDSDLGNRIDGDEVLYDATDPLNGVDDYATRSTSNNVDDGGGLPWRISGNGVTFQRTSSSQHPFGSGFLLRIDGASYNPTSSQRPVGPSDSRPLVTFPLVRSGLEVLREVYVSPADTFARYLEILRNPGTTERTVRLELVTNFRQDAATELVATSSGDLTVDAADRWVVVDDADASGFFTAGHVFAGPTGFLEPSAVTLAGDILTVAFDVTVPAGGETILMHFGVQGLDRASVLDLVATLDAAQGTSLSALTSHEQAGIVNFFAFPDADLDRLADADEALFGTDPNDADSDDDGLLDGVEVAEGLDPQDPTDADLDEDGDGLTNREEIDVTGTDRLVADTDGDGLSDGDEVSTTATDPLDADTDDDGLSDGDELTLHGSDPLLFDTDAGGASDATEVLLDLTDPRNGADDRAPVFLTGGEGTADQADIAIDAEGRLHVAWVDDRAEFNDEIFYALYDADGSVLIADTRLTFDDNRSKRPTIAVDSRGRAHIAWHDQRLPGPEIFYTLLDPSRDDLDGSPADDVVIAVVDDTVFSSDDFFRSRIPEIAVDGEDRVHLFWVDDNGSGVRYVQLDAEGELVLPERSAVVLVDFPFTVLPRVAVDREDDLHLTWFDYDPVTFIEELYYGKIDGETAGTLVPPTQVSASDDFFTGFGTVAVGPDGAVSVAYQDEGEVTGGSFFEVLFGRLEIAGGSVSLPEPRLLSAPGRSATSTGNAGVPTMTADAAGNLFLVHYDDYDDNFFRTDTHSAVAFQLLDPSGEPLLPVQRLTAGRTAFNTTGFTLPSLAEKDGRAYAVWTDDRSGTPRLMLRILDLDADGDGLLNPVETRLGTDPRLADSDGDGARDGFEVRNDLDPRDGADGAGDLDGDGLTNAAEDAAGSDPRLADTDGDGLTDGDEVNVHGTDPSSTDTDGDGLGDREELDVHGSDPTLADTDGDGMGDAFEVANGLDPRDPSDGGADADGDGLSNIEEAAAGTDPAVADTDADGLTDGDEVNVHGTDPLDPDADGDQLSDGEEILRHGTDPSRADTDGDGLTDFVELAIDATDPTSPISLVEPFLVTTASSNQETDQAFPVVDAAGNVHVVWADQRFFIDDEVFYKMFSPSGQVLIDDTQITPDDFENSKRPAMAVDRQGRVHLVWQDRRFRGRNEIYYTQLDPGRHPQDGTSGDGTEIFTSVEIRVTNTADFSKHPRVAVDSRGRIHIVWVEQSNNSVTYKQLLPDGSIAVSERVVDLLGSVPQRTLPTLVLDGDDNIHIVWFHAKDTAADEIFYAMLEGEGGSRLIGATRLTPDDGTVSQFPNLVLRPDGRLTLVYHDAAGGSFEIRRMSFDPRRDDQNGDAATLATIQVEAETVISRDDSIPSGQPFAVTNQFGDLFTVFHDRLTANEEGQGEVHLLASDPDDLPLIPELALTPGTTAATDTQFTQPMVTVDRLTSFVTWTDNRFDGFRNAVLRIVNPDVDEDGLTNYEEWLFGTGPRNPDSDGDGSGDGAEIMAGTDPLDPNDP